MNQTRHFWISTSEFQTANTSNHRTSAAHTEEGLEASKAQVGEQSGAHVSTETGCILDQGFSDGGMSTITECQQMSAPLF